MFGAQTTDRPPRDPAGALHGPTFGLRERGEHEGHVAKSSLYTRASLHPLLAGALGLAVTAHLSRAVTDGER